MQPDAAFPSQLSDADYRRFRDLLLEHSGLHFPQSKRRDLEVGVRNAMRDADVGGLEAYYRRLAAGKTGNLNWENLIQHVTTGETYFFRNAAQFAALRTHILPGLIAQRRQSGIHMLRVWSAGCATGEEPYSLAILLHQLLPDIGQWHIMILGTDINRESLMTAQRGVYRSWSFRAETPESIKSLYFQRRGDRFELNLDVRRMVVFAYLNLVRPGYSAVDSHTFGLDLILCRNVTIYFKQQTTQAVLERFHQALLDGGWLILGHSEPLPELYSNRFRAHYFPGAVVHQKAPTPALPLSVRAAPSRRPEPPPPDHYQLALALVDTGQPNRAREQLSRLLDENPRHAQACWLMGKIYADQGQWDGAEEWLKRAVRIDPLMVQAHYLLGLVHQQQDRTDQALAAFRRALYADRKFVLGHFGLANLYWALGMAREACRHWANAVEILYRYSPDDIIPFSDGLTVRRLLPVIQGRLKAVPCREGFTLVRSQDRCKGREGIAFG
jgi:chemotaxis protein methyltransferase CheR